jgi:hypothetical protein
MSYIEAVSSVGGVEAEPDTNVVPRPTSLPEDKLIDLWYAQ